MMATAACLYFIMAAAVLLLATSPAPQGAAADVRSKATELPPRATSSSSLSDADFVAAIGSYGKRTVLAQASRAWRAAGGVRALIATNASDAKAANLSREHAAHQEVYVHRPDVVPMMDGNPWLAGDLRAAAVPFLAHAEFGDTYKWMLYGDDDTVWFLDQLKALLSAYDPDLPLAITDNLWKDSQHPSFDAARCLPCHLQGADLPAPDGDGGSGKVLKAACPYCTRSDICLPGGSSRCEAPGAHGGAGIVLSVGLMRSVQLADAEACIAAAKGCTGGDCIFSQCLAQEFGIGFTDPGHGVLAGFDAQRVVFDNPVMRDVFEDPLDLLVKGTCGAPCRWLLRHGVSHHFRVRGCPTRKLERAAAVVYRLVANHRAALAYLDLIDSRKAAAAAPPGPEDGRVQRDALSDAEAAGTHGVAETSPSREAEAAQPKLDDAQLASDGQLSGDDNVAVLSEEASDAPPSDHAGAAGVRRRAGPLPGSVDRRPERKRTHGVDKNVVHARVHTAGGAEQWEGVGAWLKKTVVWGKAHPRRPQSGGSRHP